MSISRTKAYIALVAGAPAPGLTPAVASWLTVGGAAPASTAPTITEIVDLSGPTNTGMYTYEVPADLAEEVVLVIDRDSLNSAGMTPTERYEFLHLKPSDYGLSSGTKVIWAPFYQMRNIGGVGDGTNTFVYVYLTDRQGNPLTGVVAGDVASIDARNLAEASVLLTRAINPATCGWAAVGGAGILPGLYWFQALSDGDGNPDTDFGGVDHWTFDIQLTTQPDVHYCFSIDKAGGSTGGGGGGGGNEIQALLMGLSSLMGYNGVYRYATYVANGEPLTGQYLIYSDAAGALAEDPLKFICAVDLAYVYDGQGRLVTVKKTLDTVNLMLFLSYIGGGN